MSVTHRRGFLQQASLGAATAAAAAQWAVHVSAADTPRKTVVALIGCGGRGTGVASTFARQPDVEVAYACDVEAARAESAAQKLGAIAGPAPRTIADLREVLKDERVQAVIVATPDHWHGPATLLALEAGKHVYVEKPCSHNIREGRLMIEAARRHKLVVQTGTQSRSGPHVHEAMKRLRDGAIGDVLVAKAWNSQKRRDIGHGAASEPPNGFDFDTWQGPAPRRPYQANLHRYGWHWVFDYGTGDMGNDGVHDIDLARWGLGVETHPARVLASGGKYFFDDDQQFPDNQYVVFEYPGDGAVGHQRQLIFEQRIWSPYRQEGYENGNAFYGTKGMLLLGKGDGWQLFGAKNKLLERGEVVDREVPHARNFLECMRTGERPTADVEIGHFSASLCHLGNLATRLGRPLTFDGRAEQIVGDDEANRLVRRQYAPDHWSVPRDI